MTCPRCHAENRDGARFCRECGATFGATCSGCGATVEAGSKFCDRCGAPLAAAPPPPTAPGRFASPEHYTPKHLAERILTSKAALEGERKQVTVLFADLKGSLELLADRDPEEARKLLDPVLEPAGVVHLDGVAGRGERPCALDEVDVPEAGGGGDDGPLHVIFSLSRWLSRRRDHSRRRAPPRSGNPSQ